ncbi:MAG: HAMP domain-containing sensor histidine kinase [Bacillota bacterium]|nr:HAMP domain-containing sensor histidine kinase [Bacillota bacterium]
MTKKRNSRKNRANKNSDFSLVVKMNSRLLWRLFTLFLLLDVIFALLFSFFIVYKAEESFRTVYEIQQQDLSSEITDVTSSNYSLSQREYPRGWKAPQFFYHYGDSILKNSPRYFTVIDHDDSEGLYDNITNLSYGVYGDDLTIKYNIGNDFRFMAVVFAIILIIEGLTLLVRVASNAKLIRNSLKPIYEIEQAVRSINEASSLRELTVLAGRINRIEAENLNNRIAVDSAQEELKGLADAINDLLARIEEAYRSQARFVSDASHELRTPISVIQGYVNLLDRWGKDDPKTLQESIDAIKNEADNMKDLIEQLLFLARGDNEAMALHLEVFNLSLLAEEVYQESQMIDPNHSITFKSIERKVLVEGDTQLLKQAMRILVDNSIKYTPSGEKITVTVSVKDDKAAVAIQDNGIGMIPDDLPYIFDRFYRSDDSRARKTGGTGLGLSIAKWIIHRHGGHMEVLSRKDFGTRITALLPLYKAEAKSDQLN